MNPIFRRICSFALCSSMLFSMTGCGSGDHTSEADPEVTLGQSQSEPVTPEDLPAPPEETAKSMKNYRSLLRMNSEMFACMIDDDSWDFYSPKTGFIKTVDGIAQLDLLSVGNILSFRDLDSTLRHLDMHCNILPQFDNKTIKSVCYFDLDGNPTPYGLFAALYDVETDSGYVLMYDIYRDDTMELCYSQKIKHENDPDIPRVIYDGKQFLFCKEICDENNDVVDNIYSTFPDGKPVDFHHEAKPDPLIYLDPGVVDPNKEYRSFNGGDWDIGYNGKINLGYIPLIKEMDGEYFRVVDPFTMQYVSDTLYHYSYGFDGIGGLIAVGDTDYVDIYNDQGKLIKHVDGYFNGADSGIGEGISVYEVSGNSSATTVVIRDADGEVILNDKYCYNTFSPCKNILVLYGSTGLPDVHIFGDGTIRRDLSCFNKDHKFNFYYDDYSIFRMKDDPNKIVCVDSMTGETLVEINAVCNI